jgi:hypothetical protein
MLAHGKHLHVIMELLGHGSNSLTANIRPCRGDARGRGKRRKRAHRPLVGSDFGDQSV